MHTNVLGKGRHIAKIMGIINPIPPIAALGMDQRHMQHGGSLAATLSIHADGGFAGGAQGGKQSPL
jgi:hypothetical protein